MVVIRCLTGLHDFLGYSTPKTFAHLDKWDLREAENRQILRLMEKDNKKIREPARKEYNSQVRSLVEYVRKRDKRVIEHRRQLELINEQNRKKTAEHRAKQLKERRKELENFQENEWASMSKLEKDLRDIENEIEQQLKKDKKRNKKKKGRGVQQDEQEEAAGDDVQENGATGGDDHVADDIDDDDEEEPDELYCIACDKAFKTQNAFENHEKSKKHKAKVAELAAALAQDEEAVS